jgi:hypothetical protein
MVDAIVDRHLRQEEGVDALQAPNVVAVLAWEGASLVVRVDAADGAEVVLGHVGVELVQLEVLLSLENPDSAQWHRGHNRAFASADGAVAASWIDDSIWKIEFKDNRTAVT